MLNTWQFVQRMPGQGPGNHLPLPREPHKWGKEMANEEKVSLYRSKLEKG
jgi:hypothetical protein